jgi:sulfate permease, SulP family
LQPVQAPWLAVLKTALAGLIIGTMTVVFVVSKAALVFSGPLAPYLSQGIGFVLLGSTVMGVAALLSASSRSTIVQPQDVTTVMVASAAGALVVGAGLTGDAAFATVLVLVAMCTVLAGLTAYIVGHLKLAFVVRYVPSQVTAGFLAASGLVMIREAFTVLLPDASVRMLAAAVALWPQWLPWLALGAALSLIVRRFGGGLIVPLSFALAALAFYVALPLLGLDLDAARSRGWLLGPFPSHSLLPAASLAPLHGAQWHELPPMLPMVLVVIGLCLLGALLNLMSLEMLNGREGDLNGALKTVGVANMGAGLVGGLAGYHMVSMTTLSRRIGMSGAAAGLSVLGMSVLCLVHGADWLADLPRGLVAAVLWYLGFDLLLAALWDYGRRIPMRDLVLVTAIPVVAITVGVLPALGLGLLAACLLFVFVYAQIDVVRLFTTAAHLRARVERSPQEREHLSRVGHRIHIYKLSGFLFFGTAQRLLQRLQGSLQGGSQGEAAPRVIVLDLKRIVGFDLSAWDAFARLSSRCAERSVKLVLTRPSASLAPQFQHQVAVLQAPDLQVADDLDSALAALEEQSLVEAGSDLRRHPGTGPADGLDVLDVLQRHGQRHAFSAGQTLMREGESSNSIMMLISGQLDVTVRQAADGLTTINRLLAGALFGEVGFYAGSRRSASVVAAQDSEVWVVSAQQIEHMQAHAPADAAQLHAALARVVADRLIAATLLLKDADL